MSGALPGAGPRASAHTAPPGADSHGHPHPTDGSGRRLARTALVALAALALCPAAQAHGDGAVRGFTSVVTAVTPAVAGVSVQVLGGDDRLRLVADAPHVVVVHGYQGEPYLRFSPEGVFRNARSPARYLNDDRYGRVTLPPEADPQAPPAWEKVKPGGLPYEWHDHRIHWMSESDPLEVAADPGRPHRILDWVVDGTVDGRLLAIRGSLDYAPPPGRAFPRVLLVPLAALAVAAVAAPLLRRRRQRPGSQGTTEVTS